MFVGYKYTLPALFWECFSMMRKALVVLIGATIQDPYYQIAGAIMVFCGFLFSTAFVQPFDDPLMTGAESASLAAIMATEIVSIIFLRWESLLAPYTVCTSVPRAPWQLPMGGLRLSLSFFYYSPWCAATSS